MVIYQKEKFIEGDDTHDIAQLLSSQVLKKTITCKPSMCANINIKIKQKWGK